jgi:hypothetical protein
VNVVVVTQEEWEEAASGFLKDVRARPLVPVLEDRSR